MDENYLDSKSSNNSQLKFNKRFLKLRESLKMEKISRKSQFDSLLKKTKAKLFKTIYESLRKCMACPIRLCRLPQSFITNIKIDFNKQYLNRTILNIYQEFGIIPSIEDYFENKFVKEERKNIFKVFLDLTLMEFYEYYISSKQYINDIEKIKMKEGEKFAVLFTFIAKYFIQYYLYGKGNKAKRFKYKGNNQNEKQRNNNYEPNRKLFVCKNVKYVDKKSLLGVLPTKYN
jgi:hypothetical protein